MLAANDFLSFYLSVFLSDSFVFTSHNLHQSEMISLHLCVYYSHGIFHPSLNCFPPSTPPLSSIAICFCTLRLLSMHYYRILSVSLSHCSPYSLADFAILLIFIIFYCLFFCNSLLFPSSISIFYFYHNFIMCLQCTHSLPLPFSVCIDSLKWLCDCAVLFYRFVEQLATLTIHAHKPTHAHICILCSVRQSASHLSMCVCLGVGNSNPSLWMKIALANSGTHNDSDRTNATANTHRKQQKININ